MSECVQNKQTHKCKKFRQKLKAIQIKLNEFRIPSFPSRIYLLLYRHAGRGGRAKGVNARAPYTFKHQLTQSQKEEADYAPRITTRPQIFRTSDIPALHFKLHNLFTLYPL